MNNYVERVLYDIRQAKSSEDDHVITETAEVFIEHDNHGFKTVARLHNAPNNIPDAIISIFHKDINGYEDFLVKVRINDKDEPIHPSFQESGQDDLNQYLQRQLLAARLSL